MKLSAEKIVGKKVKLHFESPFYNNQIVTINSALIRMGQETVYYADMLASGPTSWSQPLMLYRESFTIIKEK